MKLAIILGSTRQGRHTEKMSKWAVREAQKHKDIIVELIDLADYPLPFFEEPVSPRFNPDRKPEGETKRFLDKIESFDAFIVVTPEYNHSIPAVLKNIFDYIDWQIDRKPFAIISHGSAGGARAAEHLKGIISETRGVVIPPAVALTMRVSEVFDEHGTLTEEVASKSKNPSDSYSAMIRELKWYSDALSVARAKQ